MPKKTHTSMRKVSQTGNPAPTWSFDEKVTELANRCYTACLSPYAKPNLIRVYWNYATACYGRCFIEQRIITLSKITLGKDWLYTLAHEIAHLSVRTHCPKHECLTEELYTWLLNETKNESL